MEILSNYIIELVFAVLTVIIGWAAKNYLGLKVHGELMEYVRKGIGYGKKQAKRKLSSQADQLEFDNKIIDEAVQFVSSNAPKWLKKTGITPSMLQELVKSQLEEK